MITRRCNCPIVVGLSIVLPINPTVDPPVCTNSLLICYIGMIIGFWLIDSLIGMPLNTKCIPFLS